VNDGLLISLCAFRLADFALKDLHFVFLIVPDQYPQNFHAPDRRSSDIIRLFRAAAGHKVPCG
jgi:hypothetical protein